MAIPKLKFLQNPKVKLNMMKMAVKAKTSGSIPATLKPKELGEPKLPKFDISKFTKRPKEAKRPKIAIMKKAIKKLKK